MRKLQIPANSCFWGSPPVKSLGHRFYSRPGRILNLCPERLVFSFPVSFLDDKTLDVTVLFIKTSFHFSFKINVLIVEFHFHTISTCSLSTQELIYTTTAFTWFKAQIIVVFIIPLYNLDKTCLCSRCLCPIVVYILLYSIW